MTHERPWQGALGTADEVSVPGIAAGMPSQAKRRASRRGSPEQSERVLRTLRLEGSRGVGPVDFQMPGVIDGGKPILRLAARISELRTMGYPIKTTFADNGTAIYTLTEADPSRSKPPTSPAHPPALQMAFAEALQLEPTVSAYDVTEV